MEEIKVSVIIPVYNAEGTIRECLDSLVDQTLREIEIICVDDGSTDHSLQVLNEYANKYENFVIIHQKNQFAGVARNNGLKVARGTYLAFLDSDDFFEKDLLERTYQQGETTQADVVIFGADCYHAITGVYTENPYYLRRDYIPESQVFSRKDIPDTIFQISLCNPWTKIYKREFIVENDIVFQPLQHSNDIYFTHLAMGFAERISYVDAELVHHRIGQKENLQSKKDKEPLLFLNAYIAIYEKLEENGIYEEVKKSYIDSLISNTVYALNSVKTEEARIAIYRSVVGPFFKKIGVLEQPRSFYSDKGKLDVLLGASYVLEWYEKFTVREDNGFKMMIDKRKSENPKVSVIIPVYNSAPYLKESLDSIKGQTLSDIEIICINDGSLDYSFEVLMECAEGDDRVCIYRQKNSGQSSAKNAGVRLARGKYLYFMNGEDILDLNALSILYTRAEELNLDVLRFAGIDYADSDECKEEQEIGRDYDLKKYDYEGIFEGSDLMCALLANKEYRTDIGLQFLRKSFFCEKELWFYEGILHEDELFNFKCMLSSNRISYISDKLLLLRIKPQEAEKASFADAYGYFCNYLEMDSFFRRIQMNEENEALVYELMSRMLYNARDCFYRLKEDEKQAVLGIPEYQRALFRMYVSDICKIKKTFSQNSVKLKKTYKEKSEVNRNLQIAYREKAERGIQIKELEKDIQKKSKILNETEQKIEQIKGSDIFRLIEIIGWLPRKIKQMVAS